MLATRSHLYPDSERTMGFDVTAKGLRIVLDAEVPTMVERYLRQDVDEFLADHGLTRADIGWWVCHPGGPKVIEALESALELPREAVRLTWESLARVGNLSSASVLHVLEDTLRERPPAPGLPRRAARDGAGLLLRAGAAAGGGSDVESLVAFTVLVALVGVERLAELVVSVRNAAWSRARGGVETGLGHYPFMVVLHTGLLVGALVEAWVRRPEVPAWLAWSMTLLVLASQALRWWCIATLGRRWNTRVIVVPGLAPVTGGPYRWMRHPNYVAVVVEGAALPLVHAGWITALVFTVLNAASARRPDPGRGRGARHPALAPRRRRGPPMRDVVVVGGGPVGSGHRPVRRPRRPRRGRARAAAGARRQGVRRGTDARAPSATSTRSASRCPAGRWPASATSTGARSVDAPFRAGPGPGSTSDGAARGAVRGRRAWRACRSSSARCGRSPRTTDGVLVDGEPARYVARRRRPALDRCAGWSGSRRSRAAAAVASGCAATSRSRRGRRSSRCTGRRARRPT